MSRRPRKRIEPFAALLSGALAAQRAAPLALVSRTSTATTCGGAALRATAPRHHARV